MKAPRTTRLARRDLNEIWSWIATDSERHADRFVDSIAKQYATLDRFPRMGKRRPELLPDLLSFPFKNYIIYYRETRDGVEIVRVLHGARDPKRIFG